MKIRIYIDTSVIGGCFDEEFREASLDLVERFKKGEMVAVVSDLTLLELENAPEQVQSVVNEIPSENLEYLGLSQEAFDLAQRYVNEGVIGPGKLADAQHIAIATIARVDVLSSWNFKHIVNLFRIRGYNSVNLKYGYQLLEIRSPNEVLTYEDD